MTSARLCGDGALIAGIVDQANAEDAARSTAVHLAAALASKTGTTVTTSTPAMCRGHPVGQSVTVYRGGIVPTAVIDVHNQVRDPV